jgi:hypothetical protein
MLGLSALSVAGTAMGGVPSAEGLDGRALYLSNCSNCHGVLTIGARGDLDPPPIPVARWLAVALPPGPTLNGVLGRKAGSVPGYQYSRAFLGTLRGVVWTRAGPLDHRYRRVGARRDHGLPSTRSGHPGPDPRLPGAPGGRRR